MSYNNKDNENKHLIFDVIEIFKNLNYSFEVLKENKISIPKYNKSICLYLKDIHYSPCLIKGLNKSYDDDLQKIKNMTTHEFKINFNYLINEMNFLGLKSRYNEVELKNQLKIDILDNFGKIK